MKTYFEIILPLLPIIVGFMLDLVFGDPYSMPHPIKLYGNIIDFSEKHLNKGKLRTLKGGIMALLLITITYFSFFYLQKLISLEFYTNIHSY